MTTLETVNVEYVSINVGSTPSSILSTPSTSIDNLVDGFPNITSDSSSIEYKSIGSNDDDMQLNSEQNVILDDNFVNKLNDEQKKSLIIGYARKYYIFYKDDTKSQYNLFTNQQQEEQQKYTTSQH